MVSVLGSGLTGLLYAPEGVEIITLAPSKWGDQFFFALMQDRRASLVDLRGPSVSADPDAARTANFQISLTDLVDGLAALVATRTAAANSQ